MKQLVKSIVSAGKMLWATRHIKNGMWQIVMYDTGETVTMTKIQYAKFLIKNGFTMKVFKD